MKKFVLSAIVIFSFAGYAVFANRSASSPAVLDPSALTSVAPGPVVTATPVSDNPPATTPTPIQVATPIPTPTGNHPSPTPKPTTTPTPVPTPTPTPKGQYADGSYTGPGVNFDYGTIQVKAIVSGGKITDVVFLQYPNDRRTSIEINQQAMPFLKQEAIAAQSASVDIVSGATQSSEAFAQSLAGALSQAKS